MDRNYTKVIGQNSQNPMMHLFEALMHCMMQRDRKTSALIRSEQVAIG